MFGQFENLNNVLLKTSKQMVVCQSFFPMSSDGTATTLAGGIVLVRQWEKCGNKKEGRKGQKKRREGRGTEGKVLSQPINMVAFFDAHPTFP